MKGRLKLIQSIFVLATFAIRLINTTEDEESSKTNLSPSLKVSEEDPAVSETAKNVSAVIVDCEGELLPGQYLCTKKDIDPDTQQPRGCEKSTLRARTPCLAIQGIQCKETGNRNFSRWIPCKWTNGYDFETALTLSVFLGMFGVDRFYLGYPALGLLKFSTLGFFFLGHILDVLLIATQIVGPADGSSYVIAYFGPVLEIVGVTEETAKKQQADWF